MCHFLGVHFGPPFLTPRPKSQFLAGGFDVLFGAMPWGEKKKCNGVFVLRIFTPAGGPTPSEHGGQRLDQPAHRMRRAGNRADAGGRGTASKVMSGPCARVGSTSASHVEVADSNPGASHIAPSLFLAWRHGWPAGASVRHPLQQKGRSA